MSGQLTRYLQLRADKIDMDAAAFEAGLSIGEARLHEAAIERGELKLPAAGVNDMASSKPDGGAVVTQILAPDFAKMKRIFDHDIRPASEANAKTRGDLSAAWKAIETDCHLNKRAAKLLHKLSGESEETRDDFLRTLYGGMKALGIGISRDLVDQMGDEDAPQMPVVESRGLGTDQLATLN